MRGRRPDSSALQPVVPAGIAVQAEKAASEDSPVEIGPQLALDEACNWRALRASVEAQEMTSPVLSELRLLASSHFDSRSAIDHYVGDRLANLR